MKVPGPVLCVAVFVLGVAPVWADGEFDLAPTVMARLKTGASVEGTFFPYAVESTSLHPIAISVAMYAAPEPEESKRWRTILALGGGVAGFLAYTPVALSDSRVGVSDSQRLLEWSAVTAGAAFLGYLVGKKLDRR